MSLGASVSFSIKWDATGTSLVVQQLRHGTSTAGSVSSIPGQRNNVPHAEWSSQKVKKRNERMLLTSISWGYSEDDMSCERSENVSCSVVSNSLRLHVL